MNNLLKSLDKLIKDFIKNFFESVNISIYSIELYIINPVPFFLYTI